MTSSKLQEPFMLEIAAMFRAAKLRMNRRIADAPTQAVAIIDDELQGLYHGLFVVFDGGTSLADDGLIQIVDEDGWAFDRFLHELSTNYWPKNAG